jgi:hypothetical protein
LQLFIALEQVDSGLPHLSTLHTESMRRIPAARDFQRHERGLTALSLVDNRGATCRNRETVDTGPTP